MNNATLTKNAEFTIETLKAFLESKCESLYVDPSSTGRNSEMVNNWEEIEDKNMLVCEKHLSDLFFNQDASCCIGFSEFTIYANSLNMVKKIKEKAASFGYRNISTYVPKVADPEDRMKSIEDPDHKYAVRSTQSTSSIVGKTAEKFVVLMAPYVKGFKECTIHSYCHLGDYTLTINDKAKAEALYLFLNLHINKLEQYADEADKKLPNLAVTFEPDHLDTWKVKISLKSDEAI